MHMLRVALRIYKTDTTQMPWSWHGALRRRTRVGRIDDLARSETPPPTRIIPRIAATGTGPHRLRYRSRMPPPLPLRIRPAACSLRSRATCGELGQPIFGMFASGSLICSRHDNRRLNRELWIFVAK